MIEDLERDHSDDILAILGACKSELLFDILTETLSDRESSVLYCRRFKKMTLKSVAELFGVNPERIRQVEAKGIRKLRNPKLNKKLRVELYLENRGEK